MTSDDPAASSRIAALRRRRATPWIVAVRMVSEGVDIPRLRVGVYATTTTTELFFRQAVGRFVRWTPGRAAPEGVPVHPRRPAAATRAFQIAEQRRHSLRKRERGALRAGPRRRWTWAREEQLSLFAALSAVATDHQAHDAFDMDDVDDDLDPSLDDDPELVLTLAPPPPLAGDRRSLGDLGVELGIGGDVGRTRREEKRRLREQNAEIVATLVRRTGQTHAQVNGELNRLSGVGRITEATVGQLRRRLEVGEQLARR